MRQYNVPSDLVLVKSLQPVVYKQYDNGDKLKVEIYQDGDKINLTDEIVLAFFKLEDGVVIQKTCTIEDGNAIATLDNNILSQSGKVIAEFTVYKDGHETTTRAIIITVESSINRNKAIESVPQWDIIDQVLDIKTSDGQSIGQKIDTLNNAVEEKYEELSSAKQVDSEVILARGGESSLGTRLNKVNQQLAETAISVKSFGAKGDGITDDTLAIQEAAEHMRILGGGTLLFPKGVYIINDYIYIKTGNIKVLGYGAKLKFKTVLDRAFLIRHPNNLNINNFSSTDRISNVSIEGIECDETTTGGFLLAQNIDGLEIKNLKVSGAVASNAISLYYCTGFEISNNNLRDNPSYGIFIYQCKDGVAKNNYIDGCMRGVVVKSCYGAGTESEQRKVNIKVINNSIYDANTDGISGGVDPTEPTVENVIIEGNSVVSRTSNAGREGLRPASESRNWVVKNNILKNCRILLSDGGSGGHIVEGNQIDITAVVTSGYEAIGVYGDSPTSGYNIVSNNIIKLAKNTNVRGITLKSGFNSIKGNIITGGDPAIDIRDEADTINNIVEGNILKDFRIGIFVRNDAGSVNIGNVLRNNKLTGEGYVSTIVATNRTVRKIVLEGNSVVGGIASGETNSLGYAVIPANQTRITVSHSLYTAPQFVLVTPQSNVGNVWVEAITPTTFDIVCSAAPVANANIRWYASL